MCPVSRVWISSTAIRIDLMWWGILLFLFASRPLSGRQPNQGQATEKAQHAGAKNGSAKKTYEPSDRYEVRQIEGWTVIVNKTFLAKQAKLAEETLALLREQLRQVVRSVPPAAVKKLRTIHFWVEEKELQNLCMTYHPGIEWLLDHGKNPEKARCVELANARNFLKWTEEQPWMILHELSHGYHHQFLTRGFENPEIKKAFDHAIKAKRYESVLRSNGKTEKAYATTNPMEFFAEGKTRARHFGKNDFYPSSTAPSSSNTTPRHVRASSTRRGTRSEARSAARGRDFFSLGPFGAGAVACKGVLTSSRRFSRRRAPARSSFAAHQSCGFFQMPLGLVDSLPDLGGKPRSIRKVPDEIDRLIDRVGLNFAATELLDRRLD